MAFENKPVIIKWDNNSGTLPEDPCSGESFFEALLDSACERLWDKRVEYSVRRIKEMDEELMKLEEELDEFLKGYVPGCKAHKRKARGRNGLNQNICGQKSTASV